MDCVTTQERLTAFVYNELNGMENKLVKEHLDDCETCRLKMTHIKRTHEIVKASMRIVPAIPDKYSTELGKLLPERAGARLVYDAKAGIKLNQSFVRILAIIIIILLALVIVYWK